METLTAPVSTTEFDGQDYVTATPEKVRAALEHGRALVTLRSHKTQKHVTILFVGRARKADGHGWIPRNTKAGRVGLDNGADAIEVRDELREYPDNYVGRFYTNSGEWKAGQSADGIRVWTAEMVLGYALNGQELASDVFLATQCTSCGKQLTDPESIERGKGPECWGTHTNSVVAH